MADNVDFIRRFFQRMPDFHVIVRNIVLFALMSGSITAPAFAEVTGLSIGISVLFSILFVFLIPAFLFAEISFWFVPSSRCWTYITAFFSQITFFVFLLAFQLANANFKLQTMVIGLLTIYSFTLVMIASVRGRMDFSSIFCSLIYSLSVAAPFYPLFSSLINGSMASYLYIGLFVILPPLLLSLFFQVFNVLIRSNLNLSLLDLPPAFLLAKPTAVTGVNGNVISDTYHQALRIGDSDGGSDQVFTIPWVHSGPAGGFGSGLMFPRLTDENTFFLHIPSNHTLNLSDPSDISRFEEPPKAEKLGKASELFEVRRGGFKLWGRKYSGGKMVFVENRNVDDYLPSVSYKLKEKYDDICFIDLHNQLKDQADKEVQYTDKDRKILDQAVAELMEKLDEAVMKDYKAGVSIEEDFCALIEEVNGQRTSIVGINASCGMPVMHEIEEELSYDHNLVFSTDTHEDPVDLNSVNMPIYEKSKILQTVEEAEKSLKSTKAAIGENIVKNIEMLGIDGDYVIGTVNLILRLAPIFVTLYLITMTLIILKLL